MKSINQVKEFIQGNMNKEVIIKVHGLRNKLDIYKGIICESYRNIFILDTSRGKKSFNYSDILIGNIIVKLK